MTELFWIGIGFLLIGAALCARNKPIGIPGVTVGLILLIVFVLVSGIEMAFARDPDGRYANSPLKPFFDGLKSKSGNPCCSDADGTAVADVDWESKDGHYRVFIEGKWVDVPDEAVVTTPNLAGRTMVWPKHGQSMPSGAWISGVFVRCFMPGAMI